MKKLGIALFSLYLTTQVFFITFTAIAQADDLHETDHAAILKLLNDPRFIKKMGDINIFLRTDESLLEVRKHLRKIKSQKNPNPFEFKAAEENLEGAALFLEHDARVDNIRDPRVYESTRPGVAKRIREMRTLAVQLNSLKKQTHAAK